MQHNKTHTKKKHLKTNGLINSSASQCARFHVRLTDDKSVVYIRSGFCDTSVSRSPSLPPRRRSSRRRTSPSGSWCERCSRWRAGSPPRGCSPRSPSPRRSRTATCLQSTISSPPNYTESKYRQVGAAPRPRPLGRDGPRLESCSS